MPCTPIPGPGRRRISMWPAACTHVRRRLVRLLVGRYPYVLVEVDPAGAALRIRTGGGVDTPTQLVTILRTAVDLVEAAGDGAAT